MLLLKMLETVPLMGVGGNGDSIDEALENSITEFINSIKSSGKNINFLKDEDFEWSDHADF